MIRSIHHVQVCPGATLLPWRGRLALTMQHTTLSSTTCGDASDGIIIPPEDPFLDKDLMSRRSVNGETMLHIGTTGCCWVLLLHYGVSRSKTQQRQPQQVSELAVVTRYTTLDRALELSSSYTYAA